MKENDSEKALEEVRKNLNIMIEGQASIAMLYMARVDALIQAGFTRTEAIDILKARGMEP